MNEENKIIRKIYPKNQLIELEEKITSLGKDSKFTVDSFCTTRVITTFIVFLLTIYITKHGYIYAPFVAIGYYYLFYYLFITKKIKERTARLDYEALQFFEILTLTLESGRNLEQSLRVTCDNVESEISEEFKKALFEMNFGKSLIEALSDMKKKIPSETINNIILNIIQTNQFGNSILDTMYNQIDFLREKQILEIKGQINKIPNKVSIISVIFVVPLIMILILGPYLIEFIG
ncbi:MAG: type II secretion system F family protein [Bacilli bacterium]|nr:type II secretion system F family protein [Bacilli bacterium]